MPRFCFEFMFLKSLRKSKEEQDQPKKPLSRMKKGWKVFFMVLSLLVIFGVSYIAFVMASGSRIFDTSNLTGSPFFKSLAGKEYDLRGEGDGRINILLMGRGGSGHPGGLLTDTNIVLSIDPNDKSYAMLSIPRDLYVPHPNSNQGSRINEVYSVGERLNEDGGAAYMKEAVSNILDLPIHYYMIVDFYGFTRLVDSIDGIDVDVEKDIYDPFFPDTDMVGYDPFYIKAGQHHLDGETALKYARSRKTSSDFDRASRQQIVIAAVKDKILDLGYISNPSKILELADIVGDHIRTDFTPSELISLAKLSGELDSSKAVSKVLTSGVDGELITASSNPYYLKPKSGNWEQIQRIAHEIFTDPNLKEENAKIEVLNGSATAGQALNLADVLTSYNYNVVKIDNADQDYQKTVIYDYSNGEKEITLKFLVARLDADVIVKDGGDKDCDISIVIGDDYTGFSKSP